ncbi:MAG: flavodoxin family protein [Desulfovibrio sp.]|nr:flavodoxin family protein [Desulfovibrio sp.]
MKQALILLCSPRVHGISDTAANIFAQGLCEAGATTDILPLRAYTIAPCTGCGACAQPPHACALSGSTGRKKDDADDIFAALRSARLLLVASPIYFYHLPAHFKALVDRTQRYWEQQRTMTSQPGALRPALALLTAGRIQGRQLFSGALLTLGHFLAPLGFSLRESRLLRGMESHANIHERPALMAGLHAWGQDWASTCLA